MWQTDGKIGPLVEELFIQEGTSTQELIITITELNDYGLEEQLAEVEDWIFMMIRADNLAQYCRLDQESGQVKPKRETQLELEERARQELQMRDTINQVLADEDIEEVGSKQEA